MNKFVLRVTEIIVKTVNKNKKIIILLHALKTKFGINSYYLDKKNINEYNL